MIVEQDFEMLQGSTTATTTMAFPQYQLATQVYWWEVWVDGVKDKDLSLDEQSAMTTMFSGMAANGQTALSVSGGRPQQSPAVAHAHRIRKNSKCCPCP